MNYKSVDKLIFNTNNYSNNNKKSHNKNYSNSFNSTYITIVNKIKLTIKKINELSKTNHNSLLTNDNSNNYVPNIVIGILQEIINLIIENEIKNNKVRDIIEKYNTLIKYNLENLNNIKIELYNYITAIKFSKFKQKLESEIFKKSQLLDVLDNELKVLEKEQNSLKQENNKNIYKFNNQKKYNFF